jgi:hypothetical protein
MEQWRPIGSTSANIVPREWDNINGSTHSTSNGISSASLEALEVNESTSLLPPAASASKSQSTTDESFQSALDHNHYDYQGTEVLSALKDNDHDDNDQDCLVTIQIFHKRSNSE